MGYTISRFAWSFLGYLSDTQKLTKSTLALKLSVSATITPGGLPHLVNNQALTTWNGLSPQNARIRWSEAINHG